MPGTGAAASYGDLLITSLVVLAAVCVAAFVAVRLIGRFLATGKVRGAHLVDVVARVPLEPRRSLYVVEVAGKTLLVGTSEMGLSVLTELDADEVRARVVPRQSFADLVRAAWERRSAGPSARVSVRGGDSTEILAGQEPGVSAETRVGREADASSSPGVSAETRVGRGADASSSPGASAETRMSRNADTSDALGVSAETRGGLGSGEAAGTRASSERSASEGA